MDGKKSKFDFNSFTGDVGYFAVNEAKYTEEEAIELLYTEREGVVGEEKGEYELKEGYVKWRVGYNEDGEKHVGYWLEWEERKIGSVPVYAFVQRWKDGD